MSNYNIYIMSSLKRSYQKQLGDGNQGSYKREAHQNEDGVKPDIENYHECQAEFVKRKTKERKEKLRKQYHNISDHQFEVIWEKEEKKHELKKIERKLKTKSNQIKKYTDNGKDTSDLEKLLNELTIQKTTMKKSNKPKLSDMDVSKLSKAKKNNVFCLMEVQSVSN